MTASAVEAMPLAAGDYWAQVPEDMSNGDAALDAGLHSWFKAEHFLDPNFDADTYVGELRRYVPLETLKSELDKHLAYLKNRLVEVINDDYNDFVSLSTKLVNVDGAVMRMKKPLLELREKLEVVQSSLQGELDQLNEGLQRRADVAAARGILDLLQDTAHVASKVEKLLIEVEQQLSGDLRASDGTLESRTRLLERVASEVSRLNFYCNKGKGLPFVDEMAPRVSKYCAQLNTHLREALNVSLQERKNSAIFHCFHAYSALEDSKGAEEAVRMAIVAPIVEKVISAHSIAGVRPGHLPILTSNLLQAVLSGQGGETLGAVLGAMADEIQSECGFLLEVAHNPQSGLHSFNLLSNSILREVHQALAQSLSRAFSPGVPAAFHANYHSAMTFLQALEGHCRSSASVEAFRSSEEYSAFVKRWNLSVYFSLRFQDIAGSLDNVLASPDLAMAPPPEDGKPPEFSAAASACLWSSLHRCLSQEIFMNAISDRFTRLMMQLLGRYKYWLASGLSFRQQHIAAGPGDKVTQPEGDILSFDWALKLGLEELAILRLDICRLLERLPGEFCEVLQSRLAPLGPQAALQAVDVVRSSAMRISGLGPQIDEAVTALVADKCVQVLKQLRGITATYRMTTRPMPTRPSHYVAGVLVPLRQFLEAPQVAGLPPDVSGGLVKSCAERVSRSYSDMAQDLLTTVRKTEDSLKRLKKGRAQKPGTAAEASTDQASDQEKICLQLFLDVQEYGRQLKTFGLDPMELLEFQGLWRAVAPPEKDIDLGEPTKAQ